jgi:hypothetical protein
LITSIRKGRIFSVILLTFLSPSPKSITRTRASRAYMSLPVGRSVWSIKKLDFWFRLIRAALGQMRHPCRRWVSSRTHTDHRRESGWNLKWIHRPDTHLGFRVSERAHGDKRAKPSHVRIYKTLDESPSKKPDLSKARRMVKRDVDQVTRRSDVTN